MSSRVRYLVLAWLCLAALIGYVCRNSIGVAEKSIREDLGLTDLDIFGQVFTPKDQMGWVMSAFFVTYALAQLPTGYLAHTWGTRRGLPAFALLWSACTALLALAGSVPVLVAARLGMGAAQSGMFPCSTGTTAKWFPATERALASGALGSFMSVGGALGAWLTGEALGLFGPASWRWLFVAFSLPGVAWAVVFYLWFRDRPQDHRAVSAAELNAIRGPAAEPAPEGRPGPTPWGPLLSSPAVWCICGQQFFRAAGYIFFATWFATFLQESRGVNVQEAGMLNSLPLLAVVVGSLLGGFVSDWLLARTGSRGLSRKGLAVGSLVLCSGLIYLSYHIAEVHLAVLAITAGSFCFALSSPCGYTITIDMGGKHVTMLFSLMNMAGNVGAMLLPVVVPRLVTWTGSWDVVLFVFAGLFTAAALFWLLLNPNGTVFDQSLIPPHKE